MRGFLKPQWLLIGGITNLFISSSADFKASSSVKCLHPLVEEWLVISVFEFPFKIVFGIEHKERYYTGGRKVNITSKANKNIFSSEWPGIK